MPEPLEQAAVNAATYVMETAAFMTIWTWSEEDGDLPPPDIAATMTFEGARQGRLTLRIASRVLPRLSQNMLGDFEVDESASDKGQDALKEVLNMICGNLLTAWYGHAPVFKLHPPEITSAKEYGKAAHPPDINMKFCIENTLCILEARIEGDLTTDSASADTTSSGSR